LNWNLLLCSVPLSDNVLSLFIYVDVLIVRTKISYNMCGQNFSFIRCHFGIWRSQIFVLLAPLLHVAKYNCYFDRQRPIWQRIATLVLLASSAVDRGFEPRSGQIKYYKIGICCFPLSTQHQGERTTTGLLGIKTMCPSGTTYLSGDCCFNELAQ
jgi:hypothetical protein